MQHNLRQDPTGENGGGFFLTEWVVWRFREGLARQDRAMVDEARSELRQLVDGQQWRAASPYYQLVWCAVEAAEFEMAGDDLAYWFSISSPDNVETDSGDRHNCRNVIEAALQFLDQVPAHDPRVVAVRDACLDLSAGAFSVLSADIQHRVTQLSRPR